ncbi:MAG: 30S ribosomal protein S14, partial [Actinomycetales bacterium]
MARRSKIVKNDQRAVVVARYAERRAALKERLRTGSVQERQEALRLLQRLPRDASPVRVRRRVADAAGDAGP